MRRTPHPRPRGEGVGSPSRVPRGAWGLRPHRKNIRGRVGGSSRAQRARPGWGCGGRSPPQETRASPRRLVAPRKYGVPLTPALSPGRGGRTVGRRSGRGRGGGVTRRGDTPQGPHSRRARALDGRAPPASPDGGVGAVSPDAGIPRRAPTADGRAPSVAALRLPIRAGAWGRCHQTRGYPAGPPQQTGARPRWPRSACQSGRGRGGEAPTDKRIQGGWVGRAARSARSSGMGEWGRSPHSRRALAADVTAAARGPRGPAATAAAARRRVRRSADSGRRPRRARTRGAARPPESARHPAAPR